MLITDDSEPENAPRTFYDKVLVFEAGLIREALRDAKGSVTNAAHALGLTHQGLANMLNERHKALLSERHPITPRRRSITRPVAKRLRPILRKAIR